MNQEICTKLDKNRVEISTVALKRNAGLIQKRLHSGVQMMGVIKSDAYGLGLCQVGLSLYEAGVRSFGVGNLDEAIRLNAVLRNVCIYILGPSFLDGVQEIVEGGFIPLVSSFELFEKLNTVAAKMKVVAKVHLYIDTGMGRIELWYEKGKEFLDKLSKLEHICIEGVASHFSCIDDDHLDFSLQQIQCFEDFLSKIKQMRKDTRIVHMANSGAFLRMPESQYTMVRIGLLLYGIYPWNNAPKIPVTPVLSWKTRLAFIKIVEKGRTISYGRTFVAQHKTKIGTVPIGYYHGYSRKLSNMSEVLVGGRRVPVVGTITMDQMMIDLGMDSMDEVGDEVVLIGAQGENIISVEEMAHKIGTVPYEILCNIKGARIYDL
ncbi:MAG: alanine racemase [Chlamydiota bacterium]|nr:alanine racemase [Chlamydiota bacterium]